MLWITGLHALLPPGQENEVALCPMSPKMPTAENIWWICLSSWTSQNLSTHVSLKNFRGEQFWHNKCNQTCHTSLSCLSYTRLESRAVFWRIRVFWDVILCPWARRSYCSQGSTTLWNNATTRQMTQNLIPEDLNTHCLNLSGGYVEKRMICLQFLTVLFTAVIATNSSVIHLRQGPGVA